MHCKLLHEKAERTTITKIVPNDVQFEEKLIFHKSSYQVVLLSKLLTCRKYMFQFNNACYSQTLKPAAYWFSRLYTNRQQAKTIDKPSSLSIIQTIEL